MLGKMKKIFAMGISLTVTAMLLGGFTAAAKPTVNMTLWGSQADQVMLKSLVKQFQAAHPDKVYNIKLGVCGEDVAKTNVLKDIDTAADVFAFASDQIASLQSAGALMPVTIDTAKIKAANTAASVGAATVDGQLYAYPASSDTFFLYYDKRIFKDKDVASLESIMAKKLPAGSTNFAMCVSNGWYISSFFFAAGCELFGPNGTDPTKCDFNNANGVAAAKYMMWLTSQTSKFKDWAANHDTNIVQNFKEGKLGAAVSGTWKANDVKAALGANYGATKLPTIKLNGKDVNMGSMANFKLYGVNSHSKVAADAMALAEFLTGQNGQVVRFRMRGYSPVNLELTKQSKVLNMNLAVGACAKQGKYATLQSSINQIGNYWTPAEAFGKSIESGKTTDATVQSDLDKLVEQILAKIK